MSRRSALVLITGGGITLAAGSGAFFSARGDRPFQIGSAGDDAALLQIELHSPSGQSGDTVDLMELTNGFDETLDMISVEVASTSQGNVHISNINPPSSLQEGQSGIVTGELDCQGIGQSVDVVLSITASGPQDSFEGDRTIEVTCIDLDPFSCMDILDMDADYNETGMVSYHNETLEGSLAVDGEGSQVNVDIGNNSVIEGFVRIDGASDAIFNLGNNATVKGAINIHDVATNAILDLANNTVVEGDFCTTADGDVNLNQFRPDSIGRGLRLEAGSNLNGAIEEEVEIGDAVDVSAGHDVNFSFDQNSIVDGPVSADAGSNGNIHVRENAEIHGDVVVDATNDANVSIESNAYIDGDLTVIAGQNANGSVHHQATITGEISVDAGGHNNMSGV